MPLVAVFEAAKFGIRGGSFGGFIVTWLRLGSSCLLKDPLLELHPRLICVAIGALSIVLENISGTGPT